MRSATIAAATMAILTAAACKPVPPSDPSPEPSPRSRRAPAASAGIPPGHLPPAGMCRVWMPDQPPGHQAEPRGCSNIERSAPAGSWIVERSRTDRNVVHVRVVDERRPGIVVRTRIYELRDGKLVRQG